MDRLNTSCLLKSDLKLIDKSRPVLPRRFHCYIIDEDECSGQVSERLINRYPYSIPFVIIDPRIHDLAIDFFENPDHVLSRAYRRLEEIIRKRTGLSGEGQKLFSLAFQVEGSPLTWDVPDTNEVRGRAQIFIGVFSGFRNARAHREIEATGSSELREFLLINELYRLEAESLTQEELAKKRFEEKS